MGESSVSLENGRWLQTIYVWAQRSHSITHLCRQWLSKLDASADSILIWLDFTKMGTLTNPELNEPLDVVKTRCKKTFRGVRLKFVQIQAPPPPGNIPTNVNVNQACFAR